MIRKVVIVFALMMGQLFALESVPPEEIDGFWIWVALFTLGFIGIVILFLSSKQMLSLKKMYERMFSKQKEIEQKQAYFLTNISENIHNMAKEALEKELKGVSEPSRSAKKESRLEKVKDNLLEATNDLIGFLRLKSKKVKIERAAFDLNNVLNEISGSICSKFSGSKVELIFDIEHNTPVKLVGDSLHLGQVLYNILEHRIENLNDELLTLHIDLVHTEEGIVTLEFSFKDNGEGMSTETLENLFIPYYIEEKKEYRGLGLFVANELIGMMDGNLSVESTLGKGSTFTLTLPFEVTKEQENPYALEEIPAKKRIFILDSHYESALAMKKMFTYFRYDVDVVAKEKFVKSLLTLSSYDVVLLEEALLDFKTLEALKAVKSTKPLKVVSINSLLHVQQTQYLNDDVVDKVLLKPLTQERVFELMKGLYPPEKGEEQEEIVHTLKAKVIESDLSESKNITQESFKVFSGRKLLIVEDNIINQKVLTNLLRLSGMEISIANNGREAVDMVRNGKTRFDLVLMDINMPVMDGYSATQAIRYEKQFDTLPIVAFTALLLESEIQKMFKSGVNAFLSKPLNIGKLYTAMALFLLDESSSVSVEEVVNVPVAEIEYVSLDVEAGIRHSNNNEALYIEVLKEFLSAYGKSDQVFATLVREQRYAQLKMLCLDMKGLTGSIGADDMHEEIGEIYKLLLYNKFDLLPTYIKVYSKELMSLVRSIELYLEHKEG
jgi:CheY-like chemotaxis protein